MKSISVSRQYAPLRVCADICFYFFVVSLFSFSVLYTASTERGVYGVVSNLIAPWSLQLAVLVGACFVFGFVIVRIENTALRFVLSLLPGLSFLMSPFEPVLLIHAAAWVYYVVYMTIGNFETFLDVYRRRSRVMLIVTLVFTCCLIIFHFGNDVWYSNKLFGGELYGVLFFVLAVLSLRGMRLSSGAPKYMRAMDAVHVVALPALIVALFFLMRGAVPLITGLFSVLMRFFGWLYHILFPEKEVPEIFYPPEDDLDPSGEEGSILIPEGHDLSPSEEMVIGEDPDLRVPKRVYFYIMLVFLVAVIVFIAVRLIRNKQKSPDRPRLVRENIEKIPYEKRQRRRSAEPALPLNVRQIRRVYRSYLGHIRSLRMRISPYDTSEDVRDHTSVYLDMPENGELRELYIAARYGDPEEVTSGQVSEAKRCLSVIEAAKPHVET